MKCKGVEEFRVDIKVACTKQMILKTLKEVPVCRTLSGRDRMSLKDLDTFYGNTEITGYIYSELTK